MSHSQPSALLLGQTKRVFTLARQLGHCFEQANKQNRETGQIDTTDWNQHFALYHEFSDAVLELALVIQNPSEGFERVADALRNATHTAREIRDAMHDPHRRLWADYLKYYGLLLSVAEAGHLAITDAETGRQTEDPFAFLDREHIYRIDGIDTKPEYPEPPFLYVDRASLEIPKVMSSLSTVREGRKGMVALQVATQIQTAGHSIAAVHWAIHFAIKAGRLLTGKVESALPGSSSSPPWMGSAPRWPGGTRTFKSIPTGKPAPFDCFTVIATESLWTWWRAQDAGGSDPGQTASSLATGNQPGVKGAERMAKGRGRKTENSHEMDLLFERDWIRAKESGVNFKEFCADRKTDFDEGKRTLARVRTRKK